MKKIFSLMAAALMSVAMMAGDNDLLWDYTEAAPGSSPDNGLYFESKITDGPGKNNGLRGQLSESIDAGLGLVPSNDSENII